MSRPVLLRALAAGLALIVALNAPAGAGPWPRDKGATFLSLSAERDRAGGSHRALYVEYGMTARTTLGLELQRSGTDETGAILWAQRALDGGQGAHRLAAQTGVGMVWRDGARMPLAQGGLSWGRGVPGLGLPGWEGGWLSAQLLFRATVTSVAVPWAEAPPFETEPPLSDDRPWFASGFLTAEQVVKTDLTLGMRPRAGMMLINSLWLEHRPEEAGSARLMSALVFDLGGPARLELGVVHPVSGPAERAVRLGTWIEF